jgi:hypothetical protein
LARALASPCLGREPKARVAIIKGLTYKYVVNKIFILIPNQMIQPKKTLYLPTIGDINK